MANITTLINQISDFWCLNNVLDAKTCQPRPDNATNLCIGRRIRFHSFSTFLTNFRCVDTYPDDSEICASMLLPEIKELHISFDDSVNVVTMMVVTDDTIYIFHADIDVSGLKVAEVDDAITKIQEEFTYDER